MSDKNQPDPLVIPSELPLDALRGADFEECLYWLFDAMGAKNLEWRVGGAGEGTSDGGRDLEAHFHVPSPDGEVNDETWWIEAKGRSGTVEPSAVKERLNNLGAYPQVDSFIFVTNTNFSNPTLDWVKQWQSQHKRPTIRLWDRSKLEQQLCRYPAAVVRLFAKALSPQGRLQVITNRVWDYSSFAGKDALRDLWSVRNKLKWSPQAHFAVIASEFANGQISARPWGTILGDAKESSSLGVGLKNLIYLRKRAQDLGMSGTPYLKATGYLMLVLSIQVKIEGVHELIDRVLSYENGKPYPDEARKIFLEPVMSELIAEITDVCSRDCPRITTDLRTLSENDVEYYWQRLSRSGKDASDPEERRILTIEKYDAGCNVGFAVDKENRCPLLRLEDSPLSSDALETIKRIAIYRCLGSDHGE